MPYIKPSIRAFLDPHIDALSGALFEPGTSKGDLNYVITQLVIAYVEHHGKSYSTLSDVTGVLNDVRAEFERRVVGPYEDAKMVENGDVGYEHI